MSRSKNVEEPPPLTVPSRFSAFLIICTAFVVTSCIAMAEIDRLIAGVVAGKGRTATVAQLVGPLAFGEKARDVWAIWADADAAPDAARLPEFIGWHVGWDLVFAAAVTALLAGTLLRDIEFRAPAVWLLVGYLAVEVVEGLLLVILAKSFLPDLVPAWLQLISAGASTGKWLVVGFLALAVLRRADLRHRMWEALRRTVVALWVQRLSVVLVAVLALLTLVPAGSIFDQLPDVSRGWLDGVEALGSGLTLGIQHMLLAFLATGIAAPILFIAGRQRAERAWTTDVCRSAPKHAASYGWWFVGPAAAVVGVLWMHGRGTPHLVDHRTVVVFISVPVGLVVASAILRWVKGDGLWAQKDPTEVDAQKATDVLRAGDLLALALLLVGFAGVVRAFLAPALLPNTVAVRQVWEVCLVLVSVLMLVVIPVGGVKLVRAVDGSVWKGRWGTVQRPLRPDRQGWLAREGGDLDARRFRRSFGSAAFAGLGALLIGAFVLHPGPMSETLGVVATTVVALGAWAVLIGFFVVHLQNRRPLEIFRLFRLEANPILTLVAVVLVVVTASGGDPDVDAVRTRPGTLPKSTDLQTLFDNWYADSGPCDERDLPGGITARPLLLVAASGGGIRAAVWTSQVMQTIGETTPCGPVVTLLSSGVSGGSVGLALTRAENPVDAANSLAAPDALAMGVAGTLVGDLVAVTTGIRVPASGGEEWRDRAGLIEGVWEEAAPRLAEPFDADVTGPAGALILNSTASDSSCRVLVGQVDLHRPPLPDDRPVPTARQELDCRRDLKGLPAASLDLVEMWHGCRLGMTWATAAMLSARFPYVTPAGRVSNTLTASGTPEDPMPCPGLPDLQLVDGGYAEGSGIGTLADLVPALAEIIRRHNAGVLAPDGTGSVVVPFMIYLEDETRADLEIPEPELSREALVPLAGTNAEKLQAASGTLTQRVAAAIGDPCPPAYAVRCGEAVKALRDPITGSIVVAAPLTQPAVDPPLGWTLSSDSRDRLEAALQSQAASCRPEDRKVQGYACLSDLLTVLRKGST